MLKFGRPLQQSSLSDSIANQIIPKSPPSLIRFVQAASGTPAQMDSDKQTRPESDKQTRPESKSTDAMSSFGEGYATRSDEEGFGGIYGGNQYLSKDDDDDKNVNEFGHDQGSHVKEKEKGRNQSKID